MARPTTDLIDIGYIDLKPDSCRDVPLWHSLLELRFKLEHGRLIFMTGISEEPQNLKLDEWIMWHPSYDTWLVR